MKKVFFTLSFLALFGSLCQADAFLMGYNILDQFVTPLDRKTLLYGKESFTAPVIEFSPKTHLLWHRYFYGEPHMLNPRWSLDELLKLSDVCRPIVKEMNSHLDAYANLTALGKIKKAQGETLQIKRLLKREFKKENKGCFAETAKSLAVGSLFILESKNYDAYDKFLLTKSNFRIPRNLPLTLLAAYMFNTNRIHLLDKTSFLGAYDCESSAVYLSPWLKPYNMGAVFLHEMTHLFFDKFVKDFPQTAEGWRQFLLIDETMALVHAAHRERVLDYDINPFIPSTLIIPNNIEVPYRLLNKDISLFDPSGPFMELWTVGRYRPAPGSLQGLLEKMALGRELTPADPHYWLGLGPDQFSYFVRLNFFRKGLETTKNDLVPQRDLLVKKLYSLVKKAYFGNGEVSKELWSKLDPNALDMSLVPIADWLEKSEHFIIFGGDDKDPHKYGTFDQAEYDNVQFDLESLLVWFEQNDSLLSHSTPACEKFTELDNAGLLTDYLGSSKNTSGKTQHPGESGTRPGESGSRPGESGTRPGESGSRPAGALRF